MHDESDEGVETRLGFSFEEIESLRGARLRGSWFAVAPDRIRQFEEASYLTQNAPSFGAGLYPEGLVEGFHLLSLLDHLSNEVLRADPRSITGWNYGLERARFVTPVTTEDRIRLHLDVSDVRRKDEGYVLTFDSVVDHSGSDRPAFVARWMTYWLPVAPATGK